MGGPATQQSWRAADFWTHLELLRDIRSGGALGQFARGFGYPLRGIGFVYGRSQRLWFYALPIILLSLLALVGVAALGAHYQQAIVQWLWRSPEGPGFWAAVLSVLHGILSFLVAVALVLVGYYTWLGVSALVTAPFKDLLSERVERLRTGRLVSLNSGSRRMPASHRRRGQGAPTTRTATYSEEVQRGHRCRGPARYVADYWYGTLGAPFSLRALAAELGRTLRVEAGKLLVWTAIMAPLYVLGFTVPVVGQVLLTFVGWYFTALYLSFDYLDWPMSRRGWGFRDRFRKLRRNRALSLGFGTACWLLLLVPILNVFFIPGAVAGGTSLFLDLEACDAFATAEEPTARRERLAGG